MPKAILAIAVLLVLGACALGPKVSTPEVDLPSAYDQETPLRTTNESIEKWWKLYNDRQLEELVEEALHNAPDSRLALARLREALATRSESLSSFSPQGAFQGSVSRTETTTLSGPAPIFIPGLGTLSLTNNGFTDTYGAGFNASWELDLFGRAAATRKMANADLARAGFEYEASRLSLAAAVAAQLFSSREISADVSEDNETLDVDRRLLASAERRRSAGIVAQSDVDQLMSETSQAEARLTDLEARLHDARRALLVLLGRGAKSIDSLQISGDLENIPPPPISVPAELLVRRPDVREAAERVRSASGQLKLDELALFPKFTLLPGVGLSASYALGAPVTTDNWSLGIGVAQPILDIPRLKAEIHAEGARGDQAVAAYEKAVQSAYAESDTALSSLAAQEVRIGHLAGAVADANASTKAASRRYNAGIADEDEVLIAERTWINSRSTLTASRAELLQRSVQAFKALGGGWSPPTWAGMTAQTPKPNSILQ